ncbi:MAG: reverse transcriptase domain-containing protein, partial [Candidatus Phytoplasma australasiaticum]|nr:reverse transcriptase domain-containing protein [Candidatus Phytoplasma australasiaticum]
HSHFKIKDLGELKYFLGIEFLRSSKGIVMNQRKYALELIAEAGLGTVKPHMTPLDCNQKLTSVEYAADTLYEDVSRYQRLIEKMLYLYLIITTLY